MVQYILLRGGVETLGFFSEQIAEVLRKQGSSVFLFTLSEEAPELPALERFLAEPGVENVLLTFNFHGLQQEAIFYGGEGRLLWDRYQVECRNIVVDHPFYYAGELKTLPERYVQICIDGYHEAYMRRFYPEIRLGPTTPLAGTRWEPGLAGGQGDGVLAGERGKTAAAGARGNTVIAGRKGELREGSAPVEARPRRIVFVGNYAPPEHYEGYITRLGPEYEAFYRDILAELEAHPARTMESVFEEYLCREMGRISDEELREGMANLIFLDLYTRFLFRGRVVAALADGGIPVEVYGSGWERLSVKRPGCLTLGGSLDSAGCLEKLSEARISLNVMPWFKMGSHDRIYSSMRNGAVSLTDPSEYLEGILEDGKELLYYSLEDLKALPDKVDWYLRHTEELQGIALRAAAWADENASWEWFCRRVCGGLWEDGGDPADPCFRMGVCRLEAEGSEEGC